MKGKLTLETSKKLLLYNGLLFLIFFVFQTVANFAGNGYINLPIYVESALQLISIVLYFLCAAAIAVSLYKILVVDLFSGKSYKYYSLPYKKSEIIFSKAVPAIVINSLIVALLFCDDLQMLILLSVDTKNYSGVYRSEMLRDWALSSLSTLVPSFLLAAVIGFLILLALVVSRSFDPSKTVRNLLIAAIIEVMANGAVCMIIENIHSDYAMKYALEAQKYPDWTAGEIEKVVGSLAYYDLIIQAVVFLLLIIELTGSILAIKKLSDKRLNVI